MRKYYCNPFTIGKLGSSDHEAVVAIPSITKGWKPLEKKTISCRTATYDHRCLLSDALRNTEWREIYSSQTNQKFEYFRLTSDAIIERYLYIKTKTVRTNDKPWITPGYRKLVAK